MPNCGWKDKKKPESNAYTAMEKYSVIQFGYYINGLQIVIPDCCFYVNR